jgi:TDG/mug DNA glycosylase family protein
VLGSRWAAQPSADTSGGTGMRVHSFAPVVNSRSRVLILGSMPGKASLQAGEYYAHPRNLFWPLMETILSVSRSAAYPRRVAQLLSRGVGLWDVLRTCTRNTSLDSDIIPSSVVPNGFASLFEAHPSIRIVCFNGATAASAFRRHVLPCVPSSHGIVFHSLPSTSPANASIPLETKRAAWSVVARATRHSVAATGRERYADPLDKLDEPC